MAVVNSAKATRAGAVSGVGGATKSSIAEQVTIPRMRTPETGLFEEPMRPAI